MRKKAILILSALFIGSIIVFAVSRKMEGPYTIINAPDISSKDVARCDKSATSFAGYYILSQGVKMCLEKTMDVDSATFYEVNSKYGRGLCCDHMAGERCFVLNKPQYLKDFDACASEVDKDEQRIKVFKPSILTREFEDPGNNASVKSIAEAKGGRAALECYPYNQTKAMVCQGPYNTAACDEGFKKGYKDAVPARNETLKNSWSMGDVNVKNDNPNFDCVSGVKEITCRVAAIAVCKQGKAGKDFNPDEFLP